MALLGSVCFSLGLIFAGLAFSWMPCQNPSAVQTEQGSFMRPRGCSHLQMQPRRHSPLLLRKCTNTKYSLATRLRNRATGRSKSHGICPFSSFKNVTIYPCLWHEANYQSDVFRSSTDPHDSPVKYPFFLLLLHLFEHLGLGMPGCHRGLLLVREQFVGVSSGLLSRGSQGLNSGLVANAFTY